MKGWLKLKQKFRIENSYSDYKLTKGYYPDEYSICIKFVVNEKDNNDIIGAWRNEVYVPKIGFGKDDFVLKALQIYKKENKK